MEKTTLVNLLMGELNPYHAVCVRTTLIACGMWCVSHMWYVVLCVCVCIPQCVCDVDAFAN